MGQAKKNKNGMEFNARLQSDASDIVKDATFLVENNLAAWQNVQMPDGKTHIALVFNSGIWWIDEGKLTLKIK